MTLEVINDRGVRDLVAGDDWALVADGFTFTEGPVWMPDGALIFSDIPEDRIHRWSPAGGVTVHRQPSRQTNGNTLDTQMRLLSCEHEGRRVSREVAGRVVTVVDAFEGKRLNSPNDVVVRSDGRIFFTDPPYGITEEQRELPFNGVFTVAPDGALSLLATDFDRPNGIALSPDERTLYVADTNRLHVRAFDVAAGGSISNGRVFAEMHDGGRPDGMRVDRDGRLYVCARGVEVFEADGMPLGLIVTPRTPANCAWGEDGSTLFITARPAVHRLRFHVRGVAPHLRRS